MSWAAAPANIVPLAAPAQQPGWLLNTAHSSYAIGIDPGGRLVQLYWGARLTRPDDIAPAAAPHARSSFEPATTAAASEYPTWGGDESRVPALKLTLPDGGRDVVLRYVDAAQSAPDTLDLHFTDIQAAVRVTLRYRVFAADDIIARQAIVQNGTKGTVTLARAMSATWEMPRLDHSWRLTHVFGHWAGESRLTRSRVDPGETLLESRLGTTSHRLNPWFMLDGGNATEGAGEVWFGALAWSGNWQFHIVNDPAALRTSVTGGVSDFDFSWPLAPGEEFVTPWFYGGYSSEGFGGASRDLHHLERDAISPRRPYGSHDAQPPLRPVLYNSWEATTFNVSEAGQEALAEKAAKLGVELFVVDDGWFGARNNDHAGLGDWTPNPQKFPHGLKPLIDRVHQLGMGFGLWVEPEMVNPNSNLYRAHPDWVINFAGRPRTEERNQLVLNLARTDVRDWVLQTLDRLVSTNDIQYLKWDMNRIFHEAGWPEAPAAEQQEIWVRYVRNLYWIMNQLRQRHPGLAIEGCSGGGDRIDLGLARFVDEFWTSDNTDALDRLSIQEGFSYAYAPRLMSAWVTDVPSYDGRSVSLPFRFLVAMQGALGVGGNLNQWDATQMETARDLITLYKEIRPLVQRGELDRLRPAEANVVANEYTSGDGGQSAIFLFQKRRQFGEDPAPVRPAGLHPDAVYRVSVLNPGTVTLAGQKLPAIHASATPVLRSGRYLMQKGFELHMKGDDAATLVLLKAQ